MISNKVVNCRKSLYHTTAGAFLALGVATAMAAPPATISGTYGTVAIGDLPGMMDRAATLANKVKPGISGEIIRGQLGMLLGDEGLKSISPGSGLVIVIQESGKPFFLLETAEGKASAIADLIKQKGPQSEAISEKLVAVAMDEPSMTAAKGEAGKAAAAALSGNDDKFILATLDADKLIQDHGDKLKQMLNSLPQKAADSGAANTTAPAQMLQFVGQMVASTAKRTDVATIKIDISGDGVQFEKTLYPAGGVKLDEPAGPTGQELGKLLPSTGNALMRFESFLDTQSTIKAFLPIINESLDASNAQAGTKESLNRLMDSFTAGFGDGFAGFVSLKDEKPNGVYVMSVTDPEKALQYMEQASKEMSDGPLADLYKSLGLETSSTLTRNVRQLEGQPVHRFEMEMSGDFAKMNPMLGSSVSHLTIVDNNKMVLAIGEASIDDAVKAAKSGSGGASEMRSRAELTDGADMYIDYNFGAVGEMIGKENAAVGEMFSGLSDTPILEALYVEQDSVKLMMVIPDELITKAAEGFQGMMQKQQEMNSEDSSEDSESTTGSE